MNEGGVHLLGSRKIMLLLCTELNQGFALVDWREQTSVQAHRDTFSRQSSLYDLDKI